MHRKLFIPGPTEVEKDVLEAQVKPMIGHRSKDFTALYASVLDQLREFFKLTEQHVNVLASSGTMWMDITARNLIRPGKKALSMVNGAFSERMSKVIKACGKAVDVVEVEWGKAVKPEMIKEMLDKGDYDVVTVCQNETSTGVRAPLKEIGALLKNYPETLLVVDAVSGLAGDLIYPEELGTDLIFASTQKAFALPPGISVGIFSQKVLDRAADVPDRGFYTDLKAIMDYYAKKKQTPATPAISLLYALDYQLGKMLKVGAEARYKRHQDMTDFTHKWALDHGFSLFAEEGYRSVTVTTIRNVHGKSIGELNAALAEKGLEVANGYGAALKDKTFRVGHMGDHTVESVKELLDAIAEIWGV